MISKDCGAYGATPARFFTIAQECRPGSLAKHSPPMLVAHFISNAHPR